MSPTRQEGMTRREALAAGAGLALIVAVRPAAATPDEMEATIRAFVGEGQLREGKVKIEVPPLVENGNAVPLTVSVDSPVTASDFVKAIAVFNEKNPQPSVASVLLGPRAWRARVSTSMRFATSQKLVAVAELSDGTFWSNGVEVVVTLAACVEET